ncbi:riboflavin synthase [Actinomyces naeslundii]|uniref:Riboflavin synthase n=2 Tax=Actinomyces naeslundii TaxID=1655 RepID=J3F4X5_ACTNH|nr:riboflavin synthase [Actinomyces naeslundii]EJN85947.1 riboflavin synthase, alpha subunit [Actinomyces naeslundii str. Howell 279]OMG31260.1 riboflavin synthase [Actinomyces naeslundii]OMG34362.1 riboflavin synthase [Actinomyces naeslundii]QQC20401.1 riboflavin synthase [Actinomyces naeslundii]
MFTGIVEELGRVVRLETIEDCARLTVEAPTVTQDASLGDSISVNGCCLTVAAMHGSTFTADLMAETLTRTTLGSQAPGDPVNLERALRATDRLGGHIVQGHVDATAEVLDRSHGEHWDLLRVGLPQEIARYVAVKGSVALDGVSLTVVDVEDAQHNAPDASPTPGAGASLSVGLIPETLRRTTLGTRRPGERVNLEVDVMAKYAERLLGARLGEEDRQAC